MPCKKWPTSWALSSSADDLNTIDDLESAFAAGLRDDVSTFYTAERAFYVR